ncbi:MAG: hypothetical protein HZB39_04335 [Planctomycetes bacterium]|nr:hypothetical protein [Planctomycetota bacterium]
MHRIRVPLAAVLSAVSAFVVAREDARAQGLVLPRIFGSHMVLQQQATVPVFGRTAAGASVEVTASWPGAKRVATRADAQGRFRVDLETPAAGGPFTVIVASGNEALRFEDVLCGEVWLCSGQSNMEWALRGVDGGDAAIARTAATPRSRARTARGCGCSTSKTAPRPLRSTT